MLTWTRNVRYPFPRTSILKLSRGRMPLDHPTRDHLQHSLSLIPFLKVLYPHQIENCRDAGVNFFNSLFLLIRILLMEKE